MVQSSSTPSTRGGDYGRKADELADKAVNVAEKASDKIERTVRDVADQGRVATENIQVVAENFKTAVDKSVKDQPLTTLAVAAAVGFVIGAIWKA
jgi:ElaB/YqjD/DUF883 family membrane-anchored ribosome-binding protein